MVIGECVSPVKGFSRVRENFNNEARKSFIGRGLLISWVASDQNIRIVKSIERFNSRFHVRDVDETVVHGHVTEGLEKHHGDGAAGKHVTEDHLSDDVETGLLVGNGLDDTDGDDEEDGEKDGEDVGPGGKLGGELALRSQRHKDVH